jgi:hypothetical protein
MEMSCLVAKRCKGGAKAMPGLCTTSRPLLIQQRVAARVAHAPQGRLKPAEHACQVQFRAAQIRICGTKGRSGDVKAKF